MSPQDTQACLNCTQNRINAVQGARDLETLRMSSGDERRALAHHGVVSLRQRQNEVVNIGSAGGGMYLLHGQAFVAVCDILGGGSIKEVWLLTDDRDVVAQVVDINRLEALVANSDGTRARLV